MHQHSRFSAAEEDSVRRRFTPHVRRDDRGRSSRSLRSSRLERRRDLHQRDDRRADRAASIPVEEGRRRRRARRPDADRRARWHQHRRSDQEIEERAVSVRERGVVAD